MKYHAKLDYADRSHLWWNHSKEELTKLLVVPFINGQVVLINQDSKERLLNMKNVTLLTIYKTEEWLVDADGKSIEEQIREDKFTENECTPEILNEIQIDSSFEPSTSLLEKAFQPPKPQVFIIMQFGDEILDSAYEGAYKMVIEKFNLKCIRIDEIQDSGKITDQMLEKIAESKYIIADLTGSKPNCYYECGFAHALGKKMILSIHKDDSVHFDLAGYRFIQWKTEAELRRKLKKRMQTLEVDKYKSD